MTNQITIKVTNGKIFLYFNNLKSPDLFRRCLNVVKYDRSNFYLPEEKAWIINPSNINNLIETYENFVTIDYNKEEIDALLVSAIVNPELRVNRKKIDFNKSLMVYDPIKGKEPFENYQIEDIERGLNQNRFGFYLDMGLGKTYILSSLIKHLFSYNLASKVVYITSNLGSLGVSSEIHRFTNIPLNRMQTVAYLEAIPSPLKSKDKKEQRDLEIKEALSKREPFKEDIDIVIMNYTSLRHITNHYYNKDKPKSKQKQLTSRSRNLENILPLKEWIKENKAILILDESHNLANPKSIQSKIIDSHKEHFHYRYLASGTPADKQEKLYQQCKILDESIVEGMGYYEWLNKYAYLGDGFSKTSITGWKEKELNQLTQLMVNKYCVYRKAKDCLTIKMPDRKYLYLDMSKKHKDLYEQFIQKSLGDLYTEKNKLQVSDVKNLFPYIVLTLENPLLLSQPKYTSWIEGLSKVFKEFKDEDNTKLNLLNDIVEEKVKENNKGIIWTQHPYTANMLKEKFAKYNPLIINGETPNEDRQQIIDDYSNKEDHYLLILSIQAANSAITVLAAQWSFYFERGFSFVNFDQSTRRNVRIGQDKDTEIFIPIFNHSLDVYFMNLLEKKENIANTLLTKEYLSKNEWLDIFKLEA